MDLKLIGYRIKFLRINNTHYSQIEFATIINVDKAYISRVESGKQNLTLESLIKICTVMYWSKCFYERFI